MFAIQHQNLDGVARISVSGEMTIYSAGEMKDKLLAAVPADMPVRVDLADVSEFDSAGVQLLALVHRASAGAMQVVEAAAAVRELLDLYNLSREWTADSSPAVPETGSAS